MPTLTSWKEIAQYLGKGVRTVQRWERSLELPVRRPVGKPNGIVLADTEEIDAWLSSGTAYIARDFGSQVNQLQKMVSDLLAENALLRSELDRLLGNSSATLGGEAAKASLSSRHEVALETSTRMRRECAELAEVLKKAQQHRPVDGHTADDSAA
jgi:predicted DNA-binding transcriptional regulator AlpA